jgi:hypothetical protein
MPVAVYYPGSWAPEQAEKLPEISGTKRSNAGRVYERDNT